MSRIIEYRGGQWRLSEPTRTSDGFLLANGILLDPDTGEDFEDEDGYPVIHSFFLGS